MAGELTAHSTGSGNLMHPNSVSKVSSVLSTCKPNTAKAGNDIPIPGQRDRPKSFMDLKPEGQALKYITYGLRCPFHGSFSLKIKKKTTFWTLNM